MQQPATEPGESHMGMALHGMWKAGLTEVEILRVICLKRDILAGKRSDLTLAYKRLAFARHLFQRGVLHD